MLSSPHVSEIIRKLSDTEKLLEKRRKFLELKIIEIQKNFNESEKASNYKNILEDQLEQIQSTLTIFKVHRKVLKFSHENEKQEEIVEVISSAYLSQNEEEEERELLRELEELANQNF